MPSGIRLVLEAARVCERIVAAVREGRIAYTEAVILAEH
jgi:hypothetical protein